MVLESAAMSDREPALITATDVVKRYGRRGILPAAREATTALDGVSVEVSRGTSIGLAGESGSGKSTLLRLLLGLERPTGGSVRFEGVPLERMSRTQRRRFRAGVQAVFQDPASSIDPRQRLWSALTEPAWALDHLSGRRARMDLAERLLADVGLDSTYLERLPHQLSGGELQRATIARALSCRPALIMLDEPVTALDTVIRKQILDLLARTRAEQDVSYVAVSHDLHALYNLVDQVYIMFHGKVVEQGAITEVMANPTHPYTRMLVNCLHDPLYVDEAATAGGGAAAPSR